MRLITLPATTMVPGNIGLQSWETRRQMRVMNNITKVARLCTGCDQKQFLKFHKYSTFWSKENRLSVDILSSNAIVFILYQTHSHCQVCSTVQRRWSYKNVAENSNDLIYVRAQLSTIPMDRDNNIRSFKLEFTSSDIWPRWFQSCLLTEYESMQDLNSNWLHFGSFYIWTMITECRKN